MIYYIINSVDMTDYIVSRSLSISSTLSYHASSATFALQSPLTVPADGNDVKIYIDTVDNLIFAGIIYSISLTYPAPGIKKYTLQCSDYSRLFDKRLVPETYFDGMAVKDMIIDIVTKYTSGFTTNHVLPVGTLLGDVTFNYRTPTDCIREVCESNGSINFYIDYTKDVHAFYTEIEYAPYSLNDAFMEEFAYGFQISCDYSQVRNQIMVQGGYNLSDAVTVSRKADGTEREWTLPYYPHDLSLTVGGASKTLGQENIDADDGTYQYFYNYYEKLIKCATLESTPAAGTVMAFTLKYEVPILVRVSSPESIAIVKVAEGGDGIYEHVVSDSTLATIDLCFAKARKELTKYAWPKVRGAFNTRVDGFVIGQQLTVNITGCPYNGSFVISEVKIESLGNKLLEYSVSFEGNLT